MRCFVGIRVPESLRSKVVGVQRELEGDLKLVEPENLHINIKFFGDVDDSKVPQISEAMDRVAGSCKKFVVNLFGVGGFPNSHHPKVVWLGVRGDFSVQAMLDKELEKLGFPPESRDFKPHITLARSRFGRVKLPDAGELGEFEVEGIELIKSELKPAGPVYSTVHVARLQ